MKEEPEQEIDRLLDDYFEERLDDVSRETLDREIVSSESVRRRFWERAELESILESWGRDRCGEVTALADSGGGTRRWWPLASGWAAAAAILIAWIAWPTKTGSPAGAESGTPRARAVETSEARAENPASSGTGVPVAVLSRVEGVGAEPPHPRGSVLESGREVVLDEGMMELDFYSGARVIIRGPARFVPVSDLQLTMHQGGAEADVPESAIGFRVVLPDGVITDFGTRFGVEVGPDGTSRVQVSEGEIELDYTDTRTPPRRLFEGEAVRLTGPGGPEAIDFRPLEFDRSLDLLSARFDRTRVRRWEAFCRRLGTRDDVLVHFRLTPSDRGSRVIRNHATVPGAPESATVVSAEWTEGRWPGKPALSFRRPSDRVRIDIPGTYPQVTFAAWVRIDGLPRQYNGLFLSEFGIDGEAHWQFSDDGRFYFGARPEGSPDVSRFHRAFSEPVIGPRDFGVWRMLATTYDAGRREVIHYVDGREVSRTTLDASVPLSFGRATLGNFLDPAQERRARAHGVGKEWSFRNWTGLIDEFLLFSRALPADEITELHDVGAGS